MVGETKATKLILYLHLQMVLQKIQPILLNIQTSSELSQPNQIIHIHHPTILIDELFQKKVGNPKISQKIILIKALWAVTGVNIHPEDRIIITHVGANFASSIVTRYLGVTFPLTDLAHNLRFIELNQRVAPDVQPEI